MNWKRKALLQNWIARLPAGPSQAAYYFLQRRFGRLRMVDPLGGLLTGVAVLDRLRERGATPLGRTFLEIGTGRRLNLPLALWLAGAEQIVTVDLNRYLKAELVREDLARIKSYPWEVRRVFGTSADTPVFRQRFGRLLAENLGLDDLCRMMNLRYLSPADATRLPLEPQSIDCQVSSRVLEHIPPETLVRMFLEARRVLRRGGLLAHLVDFADHFAPTDASISTVNFLQFNEAQWHALSGNRYMYHNRLRVNELADLCRQAGLSATIVEPEIDPRAMAELGAHLPLDSRFARYSPEENATATAWLVAAPNQYVSQE